MLEIAIKGEGEVVLALVDRKGTVLVRKRLVISGSEGIEAKTRLPLELETQTGRVGVIPILLRKDSARQTVTFDERWGGAPCSPPKDLRG